MQELLLLMFVLSLSPSPTTLQVKVQLDVELFQSFSLLLMVVKTLKQLLLPSLLLILLHQLSILQLLIKLFNVHLQLMSMLFKLGLNLVQELLLLITVMLKMLLSGQITTMVFKIKDVTELLKLPSLFVILVLQELPKPLVLSALLILWLQLCKPQLLLLFWNVTELPTLLLSLTTSILEEELWPLILVLVSLGPTTLSIHQLLVELQLTSFSLLLMLVEIKLVLLDLFKLKIPFNQILLTSLEMP